MSYGAKFMQQGADISKGGDHEVAFSTEWNSLQVANAQVIKETIRVVAPQGAQSTIVYEHNLGYVPLFLAYGHNASTDSFHFFRQIVGADDKYIHWFMPGFGGGAPAEFNVAVNLGLMIFPIDIRKNYIAPKTNPTQQTSSVDTQPYGLQLVPDGSDIRRATKQEFMVDTAARAPTVHSITYGDALDFDSSGFYRKFSYTHDLPYNPLYFVYHYDGVVHRPIKGSGSPCMVLRNNFAGVKTVGNTISLTGLSNGSKVSIVVLKDPFDIGDNIRTIRV